MLFDAYNESDVLLMATVERYFGRSEHYPPKHILVDKIYWNGNTFLAAGNTEFAYHVRFLVERKNVRTEKKTEYQDGDGRIAVKTTSTFVKQKTDSDRLDA